MAGFTHIVGDKYCSASINGHVFTILDGEVYVDGVHYIPDPIDRDTPKSTRNKREVSKEIKEHVFPVDSDFQSIYAKGSFDVVFTQSTENGQTEVRGRLPEYLIEKFDIRVDNHALYISCRPNSYSEISSIEERPVIYIKHPKVQTINSSGSGTFRIEGDVHAAEGFQITHSGSGSFSAEDIDAEKAFLLLSVSGSGDVRLGKTISNMSIVFLTGSANVRCGEFETSNCKIKVGGSGEVSVGGHAESVEYQVTGSGRINASGLKAESGRASVTGSGDIYCNVEKLSDRVRGSGDVHNKSWSA